MQEPQSMCTKHERNKVILIGFVQLQTIFWSCNGHIPWLFLEHMFQAGKMKGLGETPKKECQMAPRGAVEVHEPGAFIDE